MTVQKNDEERLQALVRIGDVCNSFKVCVLNLKDLFANSFYGESGGVYCRQNHHHHLSALSNNSDWIFLYEMPMVEKSGKDG